VTIEETILFFKNNDKFLLASHESPDADGLGAQYALTLALKEMGKTTIALNADAYSEKYRFIDQQQIIQNLDTFDIKMANLEGFTLILLDTNDIHYAGNIAVLAKEHKMPVFVIDHHELDSNRNIRGYTIREASSSCELVFSLLQAMSIAIKPDVAQALFTGIVYDTGSFAYSKTSARTMEVGSALLATGVKADNVHKALYESSSIHALLLKKQVLGTLELELDNQVAFQTMTLATLAQSGASYIDAEDLINIPMQCKTVEVSILVKEADNGHLRCSLRGKGKINVAALAQNFGGGGHKNAAGFRSPWPLADLKGKMLSLLRELLTP